MKTSSGEIAGNAASFASFVDDTASSIEESFAAAGAINENIGYSGDAADNILATATQISKSVQDVRGAASQSAAIANDVASSIRGNGIVSIGESIKKMEQIKTSSADNARVIEDMLESSGKIADILQVISDVADETKILALNAAILSAQAGEHGKGFGVVADEIGRLATRTDQNARHIASIIGSVKRTT